MKPKRIVIVGGGFAGVTLAQRLERVVPENVDLVLVSSENHFVFTPLLAETASREVSPLHVVVPGRQMVRKTQWLTAEVTRIDRSANCVHYRSRGGEQGAVEYDHLVLACGSVADFSSVPGLAEQAYPLRTLGDVVYLSNDLIGRLEEASLTDSTAERQRLLTVVVIGGGFSGVEIAGALKDLMDRTLRFYPQLRGITPKIVLLQKLDRILPEFGARSLSEYALRKLRSHRIDVRLNCQAAEITARDVLTDCGERIGAATIVCTIGNAGNPILRTLCLPLERGRLRTEPDMRVTGCTNVWALGDNALVPNAKSGQASPPTAQFATRQAKQLARNLAAALQNQPARPFSFHPLGIMASIGHHNAVAEVMGLQLSGFLAWVFWRSVYFAKMPTLARKIEVAMDWTRSLIFPTSVVHLELSRTPNHSQQAKAEAIQ
jgi:NADH dehydrogenase